MPMKGFTTVDIGCERGNNSYNMVNRFEAPFSASYMQPFETLWNDHDKLQDVTDVVIENITTAYNENSSEFIYFMTLYQVFSEFLDDISEDELPNEATGFKQSKIWSLLYDIQRDAVLAIINKLERYNGCILADSVGLGKTFTALAVVKYYENRNKSVLVLCPKKLAENWNTYKDNYVNNPIASDRLNYDVLFHTDLSRAHGFSNGLDLDRLNWGNYDLVVIDESHNFRNGAGTHANTHENRYVKLMDKIIRAGVKTKVLMLSATPVNNRFVDLKNQLAIAYEGDSENMNKQLNTTKTIEEIFNQAQRAFNTWSKLEPEARTTDALLRTLDFDFFELLDSVTIARSRKHIEKYYDTAEIGKFPERKKPISRRPQLTDLNSAINYNEIYEKLMLLTLCIYTPSNYIFPSKIQKYIDLTHNKGDNLTQTGREEGIRRLMSINLLKRLESSVNSFQLTLKRIKALIESTIKAIDDFEKNGAADIDMYEASDSEFDMDDGNTEYFTVGKKVKIELADMDYKLWRTELKADADVLELLTLMVADITPEHDSKLQELLKLVSEKIENPINPEEKGGLEYRKQHLRRLQEEVVDIEDMSSGISIMDLGLNEFRLDLLEYVKNHGDLDKKPKGMHAVVPATDELPESVVFILKNINNSVNIDNQNRIHPFYMVYIGINGEVICDYLNPKKMLDDIRLLCRGKKEPIKELCQRFNEETDDGRDMTEMSELLSEAINSIIDCKEESNIDSLFSAGGTLALMSAVSGLADFELICFLVVK
ncbi:SNF2-related protein [Enterococcus cecorum]|uniref:SNF2-related protein n=1 Tax=Enterococcus cecorum TaxID=44008 RepID=UPI00209C69C2|nr:SNF2-related protein [Enterococcus cecorum]